MVQYDEVKDLKKYETKFRFACDFIFNVDYDDIRNFDIDYDTFDASSIDEKTDLLIQFADNKLFNGFINETALNHIYDKLANEIPSAVIDFEKSKLSFDYLHESEIIEQGGDNYSSPGSITINGSITIYARPEEINKIDDDNLIYSPLYEYLEKCFSRNMVITEDDFSTKIEQKLNIEAEVIEAFNSIDYSKILKETLKSLPLDKTEYQEQVIDSLNNLLTKWHDINKEVLLDNIFLANCIDSINNSHDNALQDAAELYCLHKDSKRHLFKLYNAIEDLFNNELSYDKDRLKENFFSFIENKTKELNTDISYRI